MSKKNLLNENTVRRFMKLAEIEPLTDQFVGKLNESDVTEGEDRKGDDLDEGEERAGKKSPIPEKDLDDAMKKLERLRQDKKGKQNEGQHADGKKKMMDEDVDLEERNGDPSMKDEMDARVEDRGPESVDEELEKFLAEMELDELETDDDADDDLEDDVVGDDELGDVDDEPLSDEPPADGPLGMDPAELRDMMKDAFMETLKDLVDGGSIEVTETEPEEVEVKSDADMMGHGGPMEEDMVNEVARRVMKRIINSRK